MEKRKYDLEERLINFSVTIIDLAELLPRSHASNYLSEQVVRSGTAPALIYGEAQGAESRKDFIHKMKLALKELRETSVSLKIIAQKKYLKNENFLMNTLQENNELIAIFVTSIKTAKDNLNRIT